jgi:CheY-like chemotaxis protein
MLMPGMDGRQLGEKIKTDPLLSSTKLLMLTSVGRRGDALDLRSIGFSGYLNKPVRYRELFDCLNFFVNEESETIDTADGDLLTKYKISEMKEKCLRVLVAEDNRINQKVAAKMLEKIGIDADFAIDGGKTLEMLEANEYDLLLLDIQMPVVDGYEVARSIRSKPEGAQNRGIVIIAMTAYAMEGDREKCLDAGMDDYLAKPIEQDKLIEMLHAYFPLGSEAGTIKGDTEKE